MYWLIGKRCSRCFSREKNLSARVSLRIRVIQSSCFTPLFERCGSQTQLVVGSARSDPASCHKRSPSHTNKQPQYSANLPYTLSIINQISVNYTCNNVPIDPQNQGECRSDSTAKWIPTISRFFTNPGFQEERGAMCEMCQLQQNATILPFIYR